jgi:hypothetical protein
LGGGRRQSLQKIGEKKNKKVKKGVPKKKKKNEQNG